jgi:tetratricopeptide (TPR) repeat protein
MGQGEDCKKIEVEGWASVEEASEQLKFALSKMKSPENPFKTCPNGRQSLNKLLGFFVQAGEFGLAISMCEVYERELGLVGNEALLCAESYLRRGSAEEGLRLAKEYAKHGFDRAWEASDLLERLGLFGEVSSCLMSFPDESLRPEVALRIVRNLLRAGKPDEALKHVESARQELSKSGAYREAVLLFLNFGYRDKAKAICDAMLSREALTFEEMDAILAVAKAFQDKGLAESLVARARIDEDWERCKLFSDMLDKHGFYEAEVMALERCRAQDGEKLLRLGVLLGRLGKLQMAQDLLVKTARFGGRLATKAALGLIEIGQLEQAERVLRAFGDLSDVDAVLALGKVTRKKGVGEEWHVYEDGAVHAKDKTAYWRRIGKDLLDQREVEVAERAFRQAAEGNGTDEEKAYANIEIAETIMSSKTKRLGDAQDALAKAVLLAGTDLNIAQRVEELAGSWGIYDRLRVIIAEAKTKSDPENDEALLELGESYLSIGRKAEAVHALNRAIAKSKKKELTFERALSFLVDMSARAEAISLAYAHGDLWQTVSTQTAYSMGMTCMEKGDITCASRFFSVYLDGGVQQDGDYLNLAEKLAQNGMWAFAEKALLVAKKQMAPEDQWRVSFEHGRVAVIKGDLASASRSFEDALRNCPNPSSLMTEISKFCAEKGRLRMALGFAWKAFHALDGKEAEPVLVLIMSLASKMGDVDCLKKALRSVNPSNIKTLEYLRDMVVSLVNAGLQKEAKAFAVAVLPSLEGAEKLQAKSLVAFLDILDNDASSLSEKAVEACTGANRNEDLCLDVVRMLDSVAMPLKALEVLQKACKDGCPVSLFVQMAQIALKVGDTGLFEASVKVASENVGKVEDVIDAVGGTLIEGARYAEYEKVLRLLRGRSGFQDDRKLMLELARVVLAQGRRDEGVEILRGYAEKGKGRVGDCYRMLVASGYRNEAIGLLSAAKPIQIAAMPYVDLRDIYLDLVRSGNRQEAKNLLEMFKEGNEGISAVNETLAQVFAEALDYRSALKFFDMVEEGRVSLEGRSAWVRALWAKGERKRAVEVAKGALGVLGSNHTCEGQQDMPLIDLVRFFMDEGAWAEALEVWNAFRQGHRLSHELGVELASALAHARRPEEARSVLRDVAFDVEKLDEDLLSYVVAEAQAGTLASLAGFLDTLPETKPIMGAKVLGLCLQGDEKRLQALLDRGARINDPVALFYLGEALFWCGRWDRAYGFATMALQTRDERVLEPEVVELAVRSGLAGGVKHAKDEVLALITRIVEDRALFLRLASAVERASGNYENYARRMREASKVERVARDAGLRAVEASLLSGDESLASDAMDDLFSMGASVGEVVDALSGMARRFIRQGVFAKKTDILKSVYPGDPRLLFLDFEMKVEQGLEEEATRSAQEFVEVCEDKDACYARVASVAADNLGLAVVKWALSKISSKKQNMDVAVALMKGAFAFWKVGEREKARELFRTGAMIATDKAEYFASAASSVLSDANLDEVLLEEAKEMDLPLPKAVRCFAGKVLDVSMCVEGFKDYFPTSILLQGAQRAIVLRRHGIALELLKKALTLDKSLWIRLRMSAELATTIWPQEGDAKELAMFGIETIEATQAIHRFGSLVAYIADVALGKGAGLKYFEKWIKAMPADAETRNNIAYYLSVGGIDLSRSLKEVRLSEVLGSKGHGFYFETEAWALFLQGKIQEARRLQLKARALWSMDQGGGLAESFYHLGQILEACKDLQGAKEAFRRAVVLEPSEGAARRALERFLTIQ